MIQLTRAWRLLVLSGAVGLLVACGGGGGGSDDSKGGSDGNSGGNNSSASSVSSGSSSSAMGSPGLPPMLSGRPGEFGDVVVQALGNLDAVEISYRPNGNDELKTLSLGPQQTQTLRLPSGIAPDMKLTSVPDRQHCELSVDWEFNVMPRNQVVEVECVDRFMLPVSIEAYPLQWVAFSGVSLADVKAELRVELLVGSTSQNIPFVIENNALLFMMPDLEPGAGQVKLWQGTTSLAQMPLTIKAIPTLNTATFVDGWFADQFDGVEDALSPEELSLWQAKYNAESMQFRNAFDALNDDEKLQVARYLWANLSAANELLNPPLGPLLLQKPSMQLCGKHVIELASFTTLVSSWSVGAIALGASVTGPAAPAAVLASGLVVSAFTIKALNTIPTMVKNTVAACTDYRGESGLVGEDATDNLFSMNKSRLQKTSDTGATITRTLDLAHGQAYQTALRVKRVLPANLISGLGSLQIALQPISGMVGERLDWLYLFDFDERMLLSSVSSLGVTGEQIRANTLNFDESILSIELAFVGEPMPDQPVPFTITGVASTTDTWLGKTVDVSLDIKGHLTGKPPVAFDAQFHFASDEVFKFTVPVEFATSTKVVVKPEHGQVFDGVELGEFYYFPKMGSREHDSFEYEATSRLGSSKGKVTLTRQDDCTYQDSEYGRLWVCKYAFNTYERSLAVSVLIKDDFLFENGNCREVSREVNVFYKDQPGAPDPDHNDPSTISASIKNLQCSESTRQYVNHYTETGTNSTLRIARNKNGGLDEYFYSTSSPGYYNQIKGEFRNYRSCGTIRGNPFSTRNSSFYRAGSSGAEYSNYLTDASLIYCPSVQPADLVPFPADFAVDYLSAFRYGLQLLEKQGIKVK